MRRQPLVGSLIVVVGLALAATAEAGNGGFGPPTPESPNAARIDTSYWLIFGLTAAIFVLVETALVVFLVRFRSRGRPREVEGPQLRGNTSLELAWTVAPILILTAIAGFVLYKLPGIKDVPSARAAPDQVNVKVVGHQFYWNFRYPNGVITVDRMYAPQGRVVTLDITSTDVNHSWWIPKLGGKFDAIPGKTNHLWFRAQKTGVYYGQCAEFCGIQHAAMLAAVQVMPSSEFDSWLSRTAAAQKAGTSDLGKMTFAGSCAKCHGMDGGGLIGPKLKGNPLLNDKGGLTTVIRQGRGKMPAVGATWEDRQLNAVIAYLQKNLALRREAPQQGGSGGG